MDPFQKNINIYSRVPSYDKWLSTFAYVGKGMTEGTVKDAILHFFYQGVSPWIQGFGYSWSQPENSIAQKFLRACHTIATTSAMAGNYHVVAPQPMHRDLPEDRETFDFLVDIWSFVELMSDWEFRTEIIGTRLEYLLREFCYVWVNVESGYPGSRTEHILNAEMENGSEDDNGATMLPDGNWSRRKHDLY